MNKYEMIYESICDLYNEGVLTEEEANEVNDLAYEKYVEEKTRYDRELEKNPDKAMHGTINALASRKVYLNDLRDRAEYERLFGDHHKAKAYDKRADHIKKEIGIVPLEYDVTGIGMKKRAKESQKEYERRIKELKKSGASREDIGDNIAQAFISKRASGDGGSAYSNSSHLDQYNKYYKKLLEKRRKEREDE